jgi:hypothetical protein
MIASLMDGVQRYEGAQQANQARTLRVLDSQNATHFARVLRTALGLNDHEIDVIDDVVGEVAGGVLKLIGRFIFEVLFEFLIKGAGYLLCQPFNRKDLNADGGLVVVVGLAFWTMVGVIVYAIKRQL